VTTPTEKFPRSAELPSQSPLFWVEQKDRYLRQLLIRDIEALTGRRLLVYFANRSTAAQIDMRDCTMFYELFGDVAGAAVDLFLETAGGITDATEGLISTIQNMTADFRVVVPNSAKSNGTLLGLASKSIVMGATSELGPIEPSLQSIPVSILTQPQIQAQNFPLFMAAQFALQQTRGLAKKLLAAGMMRSKTDRIDEVVHKLSTREVYFSHGSVIDHGEAASLGLDITYLPPEDEIWKRLWLLYCMYEHDCRRNGLMKVFEGRARSTAIAIPAPAVPPAAP
jgi:hypothetical protein